MPEEIEVQPEEIIEEQPKTGFLEKLKLHKFKILGGVLGVFIFTGALFGAYKIVQRQTESAPQPIVNPEQDEESCVKTDTGEEMSLSEAKEIFLQSECVEEGSLKEEYFCNENTGTWWLDLEIDKPGCAPACVINISTEEAEINWRCTGLIPEDEKRFVCPENNKIDCMPMINEKRGWFCEKEYLDWARENCPGITITH